VEHETKETLMNRRTFLASATAVAATTAWGADFPPAPFISTNSYPWGTFAKRTGEKFELHSDDLLKKIASTGIAGYEPNIGKPAEFDGLADRLAANGLRMPSIYVNSHLHEESKVKESLASVLAIAKRAKELGVKTIVTNPSPIRWGGSEDKTESQLLGQAKALDALGAELRKTGIALAYHNHDSELRVGAREFHHMLTATDPQNVSFCLDAHWIFRGCGDSQLALFDAIQHYGSRVVELHLRQSTKGKWDEVFAAKGDIDYGRLIEWLKARRLAPLIVLEQAVEQGSPNVLDVVAAHRVSLKNAREAFAEIAGKP
jgi:inosose dehydratase